MAFFEGTQMTAGYGDGPDIISSCSINANRGEIVAILGPNGAGKSTAMKAMLGLLNLKSGNVTLDGEDISKISPQDRVKQGISFVPQTRNVFAELTVKENLEIGGFLREEGLDKMIENIYNLEEIHKLKGSFKLVISDIAPNLSGIGAVDSENILDLNMLTVKTAYDFLDSDGSLIMKTFQNSNLKTLRKDMELSFKLVQTYKPAASKKQSGEIYLYGVK